jgi:hypothetical protein
MGIIIRITLTLTLFFAGSLNSSPFHYLYKIQSDRQIASTEDLNFQSKKASTQWWYFDCFFEDGSVLVFLFTPYQWWSENEKMPTHKSLFYISYMNAKGEVESESKVFDAKEVIYDKKSIKCPYFELSRAHDEHARNYTVNFFMDKIKGTAKIKSVSKAFSPFPTGSMGPLLSKYILKLKGQGSSFRYASHVPQGNIDCHLTMNDTLVDLSGKAYHEQGWFSGLPHQMGAGWSWVHFVSKNINIFGTPEQFLCLEKDGKRLIGGLHTFDKGCVLSDMVYANPTENYLLGGKLSFASSKLSFEVTPTGKPSIPLIFMPSVDTDQSWGTALQPSVITFRQKGIEVKEEGWLLLESCRMSKKNVAVQASAKK